MVKEWKPWWEGMGSVLACTMTCGTVNTGSQLAGVQSHLGGKPQHGCEGVSRLGELKQKAHPKYGRHPPVDWGLKLHKKEKVSRALQIRSDLLPQALATMTPLLWWAVPWNAKQKQISACLSCFYGAFCPSHEEGKWSKLSAWNTQDTATVRLQLLLGLLDNLSPKF